MTHANDNRDRKRERENTLGAVVFGVLVLTIVGCLLVAGIVL